VIRRYSSRSTPCGRAGGTAATLCRGGGLVAHRRSAGGRLEIVFGRMLPSCRSSCALARAGALYEGAGFFLVLRAPVDQPAPPTLPALRVPRCCRSSAGRCSAGSSHVVIAVPVLPGIFAHLGRWLPSVRWSPSRSLLVGVTCFLAVRRRADRAAGISRCRELIRAGSRRRPGGSGRRAALPRYSIAAGLIVSGVAAMIGAGLSQRPAGRRDDPGAGVQVAVNLVTYAELRNARPVVSPARWPRAQLLPGDGVRATSSAHRPTARATPRAGPAQVQPYRVVSALERNSPRSPRTPGTPSVSPPTLELRCRASAVRRRTASAHAPA